MFTPARLSLLLLAALVGGATNGSHPSDLGFVRQADLFEPVLRRALGGWAEYFLPRPSAATKANGQHNTQDLQDGFHVGRSDEAIV